MSSEPRFPQAEQAIALARAGYHMLPVVAGKKAPALIKDFPKEASNDPALVHQWAAQYPGCNWAISTTRFNGGQYLIAVDVDNGQGKCGDASVMDLELEGYELPPTFEQRSPAGGRHLVYIAPHPVKQGANVLGPSIDIRGNGGYILAAGSVTDAGAYTVTDPRAPSPAPAWLLEKCGKAKEKPAKAKRTPAVDVDADNARRRAVEYLTGAAPAIEGQAGDETSYKAACRVRDYGVSEPDCLLLMAEHWNPRCSPPWSHDELAKKVANAYSYATQAPGAAAPEVAFAAAPHPPGTPAQPHTPEWLDYFNERFFVVNQSGDVLVYRPTHDDALGRDYLERLSFESLRGMYRNQSVTVIDRKSGKPAVIDVATAWLDHPRRRQYLDGIAFMPGKEVPAGKFNLWRGFAVDPKPGDWSRMRVHIRDVICAGNDECFRYVLGWFARLVQLPGEQGQVALVLRGGRGVGKGTLGEAFLTIFGQHGLHISNPEHFVGRFNGHLRDACFIFGDECFFAGNKQHESTLKTLITERQIPIESKFETPVMVKNVAHVMLASNDEWVIPAGRDERRYCVLDVADTYQERTPASRKYWDTLRREMKSGGIPAMLHDLLAYDLAAFDVFNVPQTDALADQKRNSLRGTDAWLLDCLQRGAIGAHEWTAAGLEISKNEAHDHYAMTVKQRREYAPQVRDSWAKATKKAIAGCWRESRPWSGGGERPRHLILSPLKACRDAFERYFRHSIEWDAEPTYSTQANHDPFN